MAAEFGVLSPVHFTHTARTNPGDDAIMTDSSTGGKFCHSGVFTLLSRSAQDGNAQTPQLVMVFSVYTC